MEINGAEILLTIPAVQDHPKRTIICLLDSGSSSSLLNYDVANRNVKSKTRHKEVLDTQGGTLTTFAKTTISNLQLPQFTTRRNFHTEMHLFERKKGENYDGTLGRDLMTKLGIVLDYKKECFAWGGIEIPMLPMGYWSPSNITKSRKAPEQTKIERKRTIRFCL